MLDQGRSSCLLSHFLTTKAAFWSRRSACLCCLCNLLMRRIATAEVSELGSSVCL